MVQSFYCVHIGKTLRRCIRLTFANFCSRYTLSVNSQPYFSLQQPHLNETPADGAEIGRHATSNVDGLAPLARWEPDRETLGERLLARVRAIRPVRNNV